MSTKCGGCRKVLKGDSVECSICEQWFDLKCADVDTATFNFLNSASGKKGSIHWNCDSCEASSKKLMDMISKTNIKVDQLTQVVETLDTKVGEKFEELDTKVEEKFEELSQGLGGVMSSFQKQLDKAVDFINEKLEAVSNQNSKPQNGTSESGNSVEATYASKVSDTLVTHVASELKQREKRLLNVVFSGDVSRPKVDRFIEVSKLSPPTEVVEITTQQGKKLYIVTMNQESTKWSLIGKGQTISQSTEGLQDMFVNPDLTKTERNTQYLLRQEVKRRRNLGEQVKISKGKIVQIKT